MHAADARLPQASACVATLTPREADYLQRRGATGHGERLARTEAKPEATKRMRAPDRSFGLSTYPTKFLQSDHDLRHSPILLLRRMIRSGERLLEEV